MSKIIIQNGIISSSANYAISHGTSPVFAVSSSIVDFPSNNTLSFDNSNNNSQWWMRNIGTNTPTLVFGRGTIGTTGDVTFNQSGRVGIGEAPGSSLLHVAGNVSGTLGYTGSFDSGHFIGNVGIGTTTPTRPLSIEGVQGWLISGTEKAYINPTSTGVDFSLGNIRIDSRTNADSYFNSGGNVGIGTTTPGTILEVANPASGDTITVGRASGNASIKGGSSYGAYLIMDSNAQFTSINHYVSDEVYLGMGGGNVGIGTATPSEKLHVNGTISASNLDIANSASFNSLTIVDDLTVGGTVTAQEFHTEQVSSSIIFSSGSTKFGDTSDDIHQFSGSIRISGSGDHWISDGNVGIGTVSPTSALHIVGTTTIGSSNVINGVASWDLQRAGDNRIRFQSTVTTIDGPSGGSIMNFRAGAITVDAGDVGLGITAPTEKLHLDGAGTYSLFIDRAATTVRASLSFGDGGTKRWFVGMPDSDEVGAGTEFFIGTNAIGTTPAIWIETNGNVGVGTTAPAKTLTIAGTVSASAQSYFQSHIEQTQDSTSIYNNYQSGFAGSGWRIDRGITNSGQSSAEFDNLTVRGKMSVYELLIHQIRATNGSVWIANAGKVSESVNYSGSNYYLTFDSGEGYGHGFATNDLILFKRWDNASTSSLSSGLLVTGVEGTGSLSASLQSGTAPVAGYEYVRVGNTTDTSRQGAIYLTADDSNAPYVDVIDGVDSLAYTGSNKIKTRMGKLSGLTSDYFGSLSGYGFWASGSAYLEGSVNAREGYIGGWVINEDYIKSSDDTFRLQPGGPYVISSSNFQVDVAGNITASNANLSGEITATSGTIGGWTITETALNAPNDALSLVPAGPYIISSSRFNVSTDGYVTASTLRILDDAGSLSLEIKGDVGSGTQIIKLGDLETNKEGTIFQIDDDSVGAHFIATAPSVVKVGIGTSSPKAYLHISASTSATVGGLFHAQTSDGESALVVSSSKYVGIGTNTPLSNLHIQNASVTDGVITIDDPITSGVKLSKIAGVGGLLQLYNSSNALKTNIDSNGDSYFTGGNVGVGTKAPTEMLSIGDGVIDFQNDLTATYAGGTNPRIFRDSGGYLFLQPKTGVAVHVINDAGEAIAHFDEATRNVYMGYGGNKVGIGNILPTEVLTVEGNISQSYSSTGSFGMGYFDGRVGIGITAPTSLLHVNGTGHVVGEFLNGGGLDVYGGNSRVRDDIKFAFGTGRDYTMGYVSSNDTFQVVNGNTLGTDVVIAVSQSFVGIGTTTPGSKLEVFESGVMETLLKSNSEVTLTLHSDADGSSANNDIKLLFKEDVAGTIVGSVFYDQSADIMSLGYGNNRHLNINSSGNVGIGTTSPSEKLHIGDASGGMIKLTRTAGATSGELGALQFGNVDVDNYLASIRSFQDGATDSARIAFYTEATGTTLTEKMRLTSDGKLGIGTITPSEKLHVNGTISASNLDIAGSASYDSISITNDLTVGGSVTALEFHTEFVSSSIIFSSGSTKFGDTSDDIHQFSGSLRVTGSGDHWISNGNVGIGTTSPDQKLTVKGNLRIEDDDSTDTVALIANSGDDGWLTLYQNTAAKIHFHAGDGVDSYIINGGNFGIGTDSPSAKLSIVESSANLILGNNGSTNVFSVENNGDINAQGINFWRGTSAKIEATGGKDIEIIPAINMDILLETTGTGNVGINTTTPSAKLQVNGTISASNFDIAGSASFTGHLTSSNIQVLDDGLSKIFETIGDLANSNGYVRFGDIDASGEGTKFVLDDASQLAYLISNTSNNPYLGIGTTTPNAYLHISESVSGVAQALIHAESKDGTDALYVSASGNVGIGTSSPTDTLQVQASGNDDGILLMASDGVKKTAWIRQETGDGDGVMYLYENDVASIRLSGRTELDTYFNAGNVGIGTTSPDTLLHLHEATATTAVNLKISNDVTGQAAGDGILLGVTSGGEAILYNQESTNFYFGAGGASADMTIKYDGNIGIGTTDPVYTLDIEGESANSGSLNVDDTLYVSGSRVGIGTTSPSNTLTVRNDNSSTGGNTICVISNEDTTTDNWAEIRFATNDSGNELDNAATIATQFTARSATGVTGNLVFRLANDDQNPDVEIMRMLSNGNVGIGTTAPINRTGHDTGWLTIKGSSTGIALTEEGVADKTQFIEANTSKLLFGTMDDDGANATEHMAISSSGNVGIGTTSPGTKLGILKVITGGSGNQSLLTIAGEESQFTDLQAGDGVNILFKIPYSGQLSKVGSSIGAIKTNADDGDSSTDMIFSISQNDETLDEAMRIDSTGNVGIGAISPVSKLQVKGDSYSDTIFRVQNLDSQDIMSIYNDSNGDGILYVRDASGGATVRLYSNGASYFTGGNVGIGTTTPSTTLDIVGNLSVSSQIDLNDQYFASHTGNTFRIGSTNDHNLSFYAGGTDKMWVDGGTGYVGIGTTTPAYALEVVGKIAATSKSFIIDHPTKPNMKLEHGSLEGPENAVYFRGTLNGKGEIQLPEYWSKLVDKDTITVQLTPRDTYQQLFVSNITGTTIFIRKKVFSIFTSDKNITCDYIVHGERKDIEKMETEHA